MMEPTMTTAQNKIRCLTDSMNNVDFGKDRWSVILANMGGPGSTDEVKEYLKNIFSDKAIIKLPVSPLLQWPLARLISHFRAKSSAEKYSLIGGGSPLLEITNRLAEKVEKRLGESFPNVSVYTAMRYTRPLIPEQLEKCKSDGSKYILLVPMYPHYCHATTGSIIVEIERYLRKFKPNIELEMVDDFHDNEQYINLLRNRVNELMESSNSPGRTRLIFSAHSIPQSLADSGDPYVTQIERSSEMIAQGHDYIVSYQSRSGPVKWVGPDTFEIVEQLKADGYDRIVVVPISFTAENLETLYDIDIALKELCKRNEIELERVECPNSSPEFAEAIAGIVIDRIREREGN